MTSAQAAEELDGSRGEDRVDDSALLAASVVNFPARTSLIRFAVAFFQAGERRLSW